MTLTLRTRLAVISALAFGVLLAALSVITYQVLAAQLDADLTARLAELSDGLHGYIRFQSGNPEIAFDERDGDQAAFVHEATRFYRLYDGTTGQLVAQSNGFASIEGTVAHVDLGTFLAQPSPFEIQTTYAHVRVANSTVAPSREHPYLLQVGVSLAEMDATLRRYRDLMVWRVPPALLGALLACWWLSGFALAPLSRVAAAARDIDVRNLERRIPVRAVGDELDEVAGAFNDTLARLERAVEEMRQFSAALAHELRTPLAALRGEIELALHRSGTDDTARRAYVSQIEELDRLKRLIDHILTLARAESGQIRLTFVAVDLSELASSLVQQLEPVAEARAIDLRCECSGPVVIDGDAGWLQRLILNLVDNALKFTKTGGHVELKVWREADSARIDVRDTGVGMSPDVVQQVFERFFRADPSRTSGTEGVGLGLSLVQWIVESHRGTITVDSRLGEGSTFSVRLPFKP